MFTLQIASTLGFSIGVLIFLFFNSNFVYEYGSFLKGFLPEKCLKFLNEYELWHKKDENFGRYLPIFIRTHYDTFWSRLVGCPICLSVFLSILPCLAAPYYLFLIGGMTILAFLLLNILYKLNNKI